MGIRDFFKRKEKVQSQWKPGQELLTHAMREEILSDDGKNRAGIATMKFYGDVNYTNGVTNKLIHAKFYTHNQDDVHLVSDQTDIAFEVPDDFRLEDKLCIMPDGKTIYQKDLIQTVINYALYWKAQMKDSRDCIYIGQLGIDENKKLIEMVQNQGMDYYVDQTIGQEIRESNAQKAIEKKLEQEQIKSANERKSRVIDQYVVETIEAQDRERIKNMENPYFRQTGNAYTNTAGRRCADYNGININNGYYLKLRAIESMGRDDKTGEHIYIGYMDNVMDENVVEITNGKNGMPICFTLPESIRTYVQDDTNKMRMLNLFSQEDNFKNNNGYMNYIGSLDENGMIQKKPKSYVVLQNIEKIQNEAHTNKINQLNYEAPSWDD